MKSTDKSIVLSNHSSRSSLPTNMTKALTRSIYYLFRVLCILFAGYMILMQVIRYFQNLDTPKISFKEFNESEDDRYPDITVCFHGYPYPSQMYRVGSLKKMGPLNAKEYQQLLGGNTNVWKENFDTANITEMDFDRAMIGGKDKDKFFIPDYFLAYTNGSKAWRRDFVEKTYQIPGKICFTRQLKKFHKGLFLSLERLQVRLSDVSVSLFVHYPGQVLRTIFGKDRIFKSILSMTKEELDNNKTSNNIEIQLSQMNVVKQRPDGVNPCNPNAYEDDRKFWNAIFRRISCLPPYWKFWKESFLQARGNSTIQENCKNEAQFKELRQFTNPDTKYDHLATKQSLISSFKPSCNEMGINVNIKESGKFNHLEDADPEIVTFKFIYMMQKYQEIKNERDFGLEMLWSSIGGFVGMFIGYSMLQVLENGLDLITSWSDDPSKAPKKDVINSSEKFKYKLKERKYYEETIQKVRQNY